MATETPHLTGTPPVDAPPADVDSETILLAALPAAREDSFALLDHRSSARAVPRRQALPGHYLGIEDGAGDTWLIALEERVAHLGRASTADIRFEDARVSRRHAIVVRYGRQVRVLDDRSSAGTFVNGVRVIATTLEDGDVVRLGPVAFTYTIVR
jgi:pSer/pThr/pTyr-binding forkhead associated (FHA) protein